MAFASGRVERGKRNPGALGQDPVALLISEMTPGFIRDQQPNSVCYLLKKGLNRAVMKIVDPL